MSDIDPERLREILAKARRLINEAVMPLSGPTASRPQNVPVGRSFFDTTLGKPIWWNGTVWKDATGATA